MENKTRPETKTRPEIKDRPETKDRATATRAKTTAGGEASRPDAARTITARGAMLALLGLFLLCLVTAGWLGLGVLPGVGYLVACLVAPSLVSRRALLQVIAVPPALFLAAVIVAQILTAQGTSRHGRVMSVVEGTVLTLAATAPWLLAGTALGVANALRLGLMETFREMRAELRQERAQRSEPGAA